MTDFQRFIEKQRKNFVPNKKNSFLTKFNGYRGIKFIKNQYICTMNKKLKM